MQEIFVDLWYGVRMHGFGHGLAEFAYSGVMGGHSSPG